MIGERVVITLDDKTGGLTGEVVKVDHSLGLYGIEIKREGCYPALAWFYREDFEVIA